MKLGEINNSGLYLVCSISESDHFISSPHKYVTRMAHLQITSAKVRTLCIVTDLFIRLWYRITSNLAYSYTWFPNYDRAYMLVQESALSLVQRLCRA